MSLATGSSLIKMWETVRSWIMDDGMSAFEIHNQQMKFLGAIEGIIKMLRDQFKFTKEQIKETLLEAYPSLSSKEADDYIDLFY